MDNKFIEFYSDYPDTRFYTTFFVEKGLINLDADTKQEYEASVKFTFNPHGNTLKMKKSLRDYEAETEALKAELIHLSESNSNLRLENEKMRLEQDFKNSQKERIRNRVLLDAAQRSRNANLKFVIQNSRNTFLKHDCF